MTPRTTFVNVPVTLARRYDVNASEWYERFIDRTVVVGYIVRSTDDGPVLELAAAAQSIKDVQFNGRLSRRIVHGRFAKGRTATVAIPAEDVTTFGNVNYDAKRWVEVLTEAQFLPVSWNKWSIFTEQEPLDLDEVVNQLLASYDFAQISDTPAEVSDGYLQLEDCS